MNPTKELIGLLETLSERAFFADWMSNLEHEVWEAILEGPRRYGEIHLDQETLDQLRRLAASGGGWVRFDDSTEQVGFVPRPQWDQLHADWKLRGR